MKIDTDFTFAVVAFFAFLWLSGGIVRIDCALGVAPACDSIAAKYAKADP